MISTPIFSIYIIITLFNKTAPIVTYCKTKLKSRLLIVQGIDFFSLDLLDRCTKPTFLAISLRTIGDRKRCISCAKSVSSLERIGFIKKRHPFS